jgi:hypothetical protein
VPEQGSKEAYKKAIERFKTIFFMLLTITLLKLSIPIVLYTKLLDLPFGICYLIGIPEKHIWQVS